MKKHLTTIILAIAAVAVLYYLLTKQKPEVNAPIKTAENLVNNVLTKSTTAVVPRWTMKARNPLVYKETVKVTEDLR